MSDQSPYSQYNPQNPYSGDPQWPNQQQEGYPPANEPYQSSIPPTQYAQPYPSSPSPYPSQPNQPGMYGAPNPYAPQAPYGIPTSQPQRADGLAIAGLVLGIISMFTWLLWFFGLPVSIVGIILSVMGRRSATRRTMATVGLVLSIISLVLVLIVTVLFIIGIIASSQRSTP